MITNINAQTIELLKEGMTLIKSPLFEDKPPGTENVGFFEIEKIAGIFKKPDGEKVVDKDVVKIDARLTMPKFNDGKTQYDVELSFNYEEITSGNWSILTL